MEIDSPAMSAAPGCGSGAGRDGSKIHGGLSSGFKVDLIASVPPVLRRQENLRVSVRAEQGEVSRSLLLHQLPGSPARQNILVMSFNLFHQKQNRRAN